MSKKKAIREKIKLMLLSKTSCQDKVFDNRMLKWRDEDLPAISVYIQSESAEIYNVSPREYRRTANVVIEIIGFVLDQTDDFIDNICDEVEAILHNDRSLNGACDDFIYNGSMTGVATENGQAYVCGKLEYSAVYTSLQVTKQETVPDLKEIRTVVEVGDNEMEILNKFESEDDSENDGGNDE